MLKELIIRALLNGVYERCYDRHQQNIRAHGFDVIRLKLAKKLAML